MTQSFFVILTSIGQYIRQYVMAIMGPVWLSTYLGDGIDTSTSLNKVEDNIVKKMHNLKILGWVNSEMLVTAYGSALPCQK